MHKIAIAVITILMVLSISEARVLKASYKFEAIGKPANSLSIKRNTVTASFNTVTGIISLKSTFGGPRVTVVAYDYEGDYLTTLLFNKKAIGDYKLNRDDGILCCFSTSRIASIYIEVTHEWKIDFRDRYQIKCKDGYIRSGVECVSEDDYIELPEAFDEDGCFYGEMFMGEVLNICVNLDSGLYHIPFEREYHKPEEVSDYETCRNGCRCNDGTISYAEHRQIACSWHGGISSYSY